MANTRKCKHCGERYAEGLSRCPNCHTRTKGGSRLKRASSPWVSVVVIVIALIAVAAAVFLVYSALHPGSGVKDDDNTSEPSSSPSASADTGVNGEDEDIDETQNTETSAPSDDPVITEAPTVDSIVLETYEATLAGPGDTVQLSADIYPATAQGLLTWASDDESVATVDSDGLVTAVSEGTVTIVANAGDKSASCVVTVGDTEVAVSPSNNGGSEDLVLKIYNLYFTASTFSGEQSINVGESVQMYIDVNGTRTTEGVTWSTNNAGVATVDSNGKVLGVGTGKALITATYNGQSVTCICHVRQDQNIFVIKK